MANKIWVGTVSGQEGNLTHAANWSPSGVPVTTDNVRFPAGSNSITTNVTGLSTASLSGPLGTVIFEDGFSGTVASSAAYMKFTCTRFDYSGSGQAFIDLEASAISPRILKTGGTSAGQRSLYLVGSAISVLDILGGNVGLASRSYETASITTLRINGLTADVWIGSGVTLTTLHHFAGKADLRCAATTVTAYGGTLTTSETGAITTFNVRGGIIYPNSIGTITTMNCDGGTTDFTKSGLARTVSTLKQNLGILIYDPAIITITTRSAPDYPIALSASKPA